MTVAGVALTIAGLLFAGFAAIAGFIIYELRRDRIGAAVRDAIDAAGKALRP